MSTEEPRILFITGAPRTGTTLVQKLVTASPGYSVLSQPFPLVFVEAKRSFLSSLGAHEDTEPLGHLFREHRYDIREFAAYLREYRPPPPVLAGLFDRMQGYSGQYDRVPSDIAHGAIDALGGGAPFIETLQALYGAFAGGAGASVIGAKETFCEEFLPFLLDTGIRCVLIVRDPRDAIASMRYGAGPEHAGARRPLLADIRRWRKSVAFALHLADTPGFVTIRYEDLVRDPGTVLRRVGEVAGWPLDYSESSALRTQAGTEWGGNSSYGQMRGVTARSVGMFERVMPAAEARFIAATCGPEMRALGYSSRAEVIELGPIAAAYDEDPATARAGFSGDLVSEGSIRDEAERVRLLRNLAIPDREKFFISDRSRRALAAAL